MQNAKDTFYIALRDRLARLNPSRTIVVRGAVRPAVFVDENELAAVSDPGDAFVIKWADVSIDGGEPMPLHTLVCEISYTTRGTALSLGMDRGRVMDAMDLELTSILQPAVTPEQDFSASPAVALGTNVFWSQPRFSALVTQEAQLSRSVQVSVFALQKAGE